MDTLQLRDYSDRWAGSQGDHYKKLEEKRLSQDKLYQRNDSLYEGQFVLGTD